MSSTSTACLPDDPTDVHNRQTFAIVPTTIVLFLSILTYALRILARKKTRQELRWDDFLMGIGLVLSIEPAICEFMCKYDQYLGERRPAVDSLTSNSGNSWPRPPLV